MSKLPLVASAISSMLNVPVKTYDECVANGCKISPQQILDIDFIYKYTLSTIREEVKKNDEQIKIFIILISDKKLLIYVKPNQTVYELKHMIYEKFGYKFIYETQLVLGDKTLEDNKTLAYYNIKQDDCLQSKKVNNTPSIKIFVKPISEKEQTIGMYINPKKTISELKPTIQDVLGYDIKQKIHLEFSGKILENDKTLASCGIIQDDTIQVRKAEGTPQIQIFIKPLSEISVAMFVSPNETVLELKRAIQEKFGYKITQIRLEFADKPLEDQKTLASYGIKQGDNIHILSRLLGGDCDFYVINNDLLNPKYDYDFRHLRDNGRTYIRGNQLYKRPYGWMRIALNVNKYGINNEWLGKVGNSNNEWPVSYHGTRRESADSIADNGYLLSRGVRFKYGVGVYSTPRIEVAERYATEFENNGTRYKFVFQNRVNPVGYSAIPQISHYWLTPNDTDIRPYGLCVKEIS